MASGQKVVEIIQVLNPGSAYATPDIMVGASTPAESLLIYLFDDTTVEYIDLYCRLNEEYDGGGLTFTTTYGAVATSGNGGWSIAIRAIPVDSEDLDTTAHTYDYNDSAADTVPSAAGEQQTVAIAFTDGADMDSWGVGEYGIVRIKRNTSISGDATGDLKLFSGDIVGKET